MKRIVWSTLFWTLSLWSAHVEPGDTYLHSGGEKIDLIIAEEYRGEAAKILSFEARVLESYEHLYGYTLDDTLYLGLASSNNQVANAFSTQIPLNMQINYIGGSLLPDYFASTSWLKTILLHESAHNFQLNAKHNPLSRVAHKIFKNTPVTWLYFAPLFPLPNLTESPFMLEGNAVLNESLFGNGGRLYSGAFWAMTLTQARAGLITPERLYNDHLFFPYGTHHYIVGGFFQLFLAQKYGIEKTNRYFLAYSDQWLPFFTNAVCRAHFGKDFETLTAEYRRWLLEEAADFHETAGEPVAFSKAYVALNSDGDEVYFLVTDRYSAPKLVHIDKKEGTLRKEKGDFLWGKSFKTGGRYYTLASARIAKDRIAVGLFDKEGKLLEKSQSQALQAILPDGERLYFDVRTSYDGLQLYRGKRFLGRVDSSVWADHEGNYYYFRQSGSVRTLCKNDRSLLRYDGFYGKVADVDAEGRIYFIASSKAGSTLYRFSSAGVERVAAGDDIVDAKLLDERTALLEVIRAEGISFVKSSLQPRSATVYERHYFFETAKPFLHSHTGERAPKLNRYHAWNNLHYSALSQNVEVSQSDQINFNITAAFTDPLERNHMRIYTSKYDEEAIAGIGYDNSAYAVDFGLDIYGVLSHEANSSDRGFGINSYLHYPWFRHTYTRGDIDLNLHIDSDKDAKSPLSLSVRWRKAQQFGDSFYNDYLSQIALFAVEDRSDMTYGAHYTFGRDLADELYLGVDLHYAKSDTDSAGREEQGILVDDSAFAPFRDASRFVMPTLQYEIYAKEAFKGEISLAKVFSFSRYYFSLPLSLRRESLYGKYRYFSLKGEKRYFSFSEYTLGVTLELLFLHKIVLPVTLEWMQNDDLKESRNFRMLFSVAF